MVSKDFIYLESFKRKESDTYNVTFVTDTKFKIIFLINLNDYK